MDEARGKKAKLTAQLRALNEQFAEWIQDQLVNHREDVWLDGVEDYIEHAKNLLMEAADSDSPVSGLKGEKLQAWMNGQKAEAKTQSFANTTSAASGKVLGLQSLKAQASKPHKEASLAAAGQFAFPSFPAPSGASSAAEASAGPLSCAPPILGSFLLQAPPASSSLTAPLPSLFGGPKSTEAPADAPLWGSSSAAGPAKPSGGLFGLPASTAANSAAAAAPFASGANAFGASSASGGTAATQPSFPAFSMPGASGPSFGQAPGPAASTGLLPFQAPPASSANGASKPPLAFSGAGNTGSAAGDEKSSQAADEAGEEAEEDEGPKAELKLGEDSTLLFKEPAKLYFQGKNGNGWDDRGKGTLTVRQSKSEDGQDAGFTTNIVFTMESGKIIVNGGVYKGLRAQKLKNPKMVCMNLTLALDERVGEQDPTPKTVMFNIVKVEKAESFCSIVEQATPK